MNNAIYYIFLILEETGVYMAYLHPNMQKSSPLFLGNV